MPMPPWWKVKRELRRIGRQIENLPINVFERFLGGHYNDVVLRRKRRIVSGAQPDGPRKAIYLLYPKDGLLETHRSAIDYLAGKGLSLTIVSNLPLSTADEAEILTLCHRYIERPNFGYDFGGYRDAVLAMADVLPETEALVLMNDSVWFPLSEETDWLADAAALGVDFAGSVSHYGLPHVEAVDFRDMTFDYATDHQHFHYGSFALLIGPRILRSPGFLSFWRNLRLSTDKKRTVRYGETGLTAWVLANGYTHGDTLDVACLHEALAELSERELRDAAARIIVFDDLDMRDLMTAPGFRFEDLSREELILFLMTAIARQGPGYVPAYLTTLTLGFPFLKKSPAWHNPDAAGITRHILRTLDTPVARHALDEIDGAVRR